MARKPRIVDGHKMPDNLYPHPRKTPNRWRYKQPDESWFYFDAPIDQAIPAADKLNTQRDQSRPTKASPSKAGRLSFARHVQDFCSEREARDPTLCKKASWKDRKSYLNQLARDHAGTTVARVTLLEIQSYFKSVSFALYFISLSYAV